MSYISLAFTEEKIWESGTVHSFIARSNSFGPSLTSPNLSPSSRSSLV